MTRADDASVRALADLRGKTSAQSVTSSFAKTATAAGARIEAVEGFTQAIGLLKQGRVDVTLNDGPTPGGWHCSGRRAGWCSRDTTCSRT